MVNAQASRLLIKNQLLQQQKQHQAYARGYAEFLQRHHRTMLEFVLDDPAPLQQWRQQREARKQQKEQQQQPVPPDKQPSIAAAAAAGAGAAALPPEQQQQQADGSADVHMSPADSMQVDAAAGGAAEPAAASQPAAAAAADGPKDMVLEAVPSDSPHSLQAAAPGSVASRSTGSLVSLQSTLGRTSSLPAIMVSSKELDRLGLLLHVAQGEGSAHGGLFYSVGGAAAASEGGAAGQQQPQSANGGSASAGGAHSGKGLQQLSSSMPGMREQQGALLEEVVGWLGSSSQQPWQLQTLAGYGSLLRATSAGSALAGVVGSGGSSGGAHAPGTLICADQSAVSAWLYGPGEQEAAAAAAAAASVQATSGSSPAAAAAAALAAGAPTSSGGGLQEGPAAAAGGAGGVPPPVLALGAISPLTQPSPGPEGTLSPMPSLGGASPFSLGPPAVPAAEGFESVTPLAQLQTQQHQGGSCLALSGSSPAPGTPNGHLSPAVQQQLQLGLVAPVLSPVRTRLSPAAAAPGGSSSSGGCAVSSGGGTGHLAGTMRVNARGMTAVAGGILDHRGIQSVYRGSVVQGPSDVEPNAEMLIQDCTECHIYVLAPLR